MINKELTTNPLCITLPDGHMIASTHTCLLNIPQLPITALLAHNLPDLAHSSLISAKQVCDEGCKVEYDATNCYVYYNDNIILMDQGMKWQNYGNHFFELIQQRHSLVRTTIQNCQCPENPWQNWHDHNKIPNLQNIWLYPQHHAHVNAGRLNEVLPSVSFFTTHSNMDCSH